VGVIGTRANVNKGKSFPALLMNGIGNTIPGQQDSTIEQPVGRSGQMIDVEAFFLHNAAMAEGMWFVGREQPDVYIPGRN
jgi:hypothetical protein